VDAGDHGTRTGARTLARTLAAAAGHLIGPMLSVPADNFGR
jgi:hypothetical protein